MNAVWTIIMLCSLVAMTLASPDGATTAMLNGSTNAVNLALSLLATYGFWLGLFALIEKTGVAKALNRILRPVIKFLFPSLSSDAEQYVTMNISANILGLGSSSTLMGIKAVQSMDDGGEKASNDMIMLMVISSTSLQLIPSTVIGMRISHGSLAPTSFLLPCMIATTVSTLLGIAVVKLLSVKRKQRAPRALPLGVSAR